MRHLFAAIALLLSGWAWAGPLSIFVTVVPQKTFVERVGGSRVEVQVMVPPGANPHTYEPTPKQVAALARADLYLAVGVRFESAWMERIQATNPGLRVLDLSQGLKLRRLEHHDHGDGQGEDGHGRQGDYDHGHAADGEGMGDEPDPHLWTSPPLVIRMIAGIRDELIALDPRHAEDYSANAAAFAAELEALDHEIHARLDGLANRRFMVFHPAWGYFADTYALVQIPIEREGKEPGPRALAALIDQARREGITTIFVQPQFSRKAADQVAAAIGGRVEVLDDLAADYVANLRRVASLLAGAAAP